MFYLIASIIVAPKQVFKMVKTKAISNGSLVISMLTGIALAFNKTIGNNYASGTSLFSVVFIVGIVGVLFGPIMIKLFSFVLMLVAKIFSCSVSYKQLNTVVTYSFIPIMIQKIIFFPLQLFFVREELFLTVTPILNSSRGLLSLMLLESMFVFTSFLWTFLLLVKGINVLSDSPLWKSIIIVAIPLVVSVII